MAMIAFLLALILSASPHEAYEVVHAVEVNHFHDETGKPVYSQVIFYEEEHGKLLVRHWMILDPKDPITKRPNGDRNTVRWFDEDTYVFRRIDAKMYTERWTQFDPERENKKLLPENQRVKLWQPSR